MYEKATAQMRHERSLQDAKTWDDLAGRAARTTILINGAAATALLAYAASNSTVSIGFRMLSWALSAYALGVFWGALMTIFLCFAIEGWMNFYLPETTPPESAIHNVRASMWWKGSLICFGTGMACFVLGCWLVAFGVLRP